MHFGLCLFFNSSIFHHFFLLEFPNLCEVAIVNSRDVRRGESISKYVVRLCGQAVEEVGSLLQASAHITLSACNMCALSWLHPVVICAVLFVDTCMSTRVYVPECVWAVR